MKKASDISGAQASLGGSPGDVPLVVAESENFELRVEKREGVTDYLPNRCVHELFETQAAENPQAVALESGDRRLTYQELNERANQLAHYLRTVGVGAETLVGVYVDRSLEFVVSVLGILKAGGAFVPLDTDYPAERLQFLLEDSGVPVLIADQPLPSDLILWGITLVDLASEVSRIASCRKENPERVNNSGNLAYVIYTSGSTGRPKGVAVPHRGVVRLVRGQDYAAFDNRQRFLLLASTSFDAATFELWGPLLNGAVCVVFPKQPLDFQRLELFVRQHRVTCLWLTAGLFNQIINVRPSVLETVRHVLTGGDALSVPHVQKAMKLLPALRLTNGYGPTESTTFACCHAIKPGETFPAGSVPIGRPIAHTQCYLLDEHLAPVPAGVPAELYLGGDGLARGYWKRPELTAEKFIVHPFSSEPGARLYKTGDLVRQLPDGNLEFLGRLDQQVKIRGFRIELGEIESVLGQHPSVRECVVVAREIQAGEKELFAYLVVVPALAPTVAGLRSFLLKKLPDYMVPAAFIKLEKLPLTPNGKIDRRSLPAPAENFLESGTPFAAPRTPTETALGKIWSELLRVERISIHDNFFALGGHSLLAVRMVFRIRVALQVELPVQLISERPTIAEFSAAIEAATKSASPRHLVPPMPRPHNASSGQFPASFNQQQLWFIDQREPGSSVYNLPFVIRLRGRLDLAALRWSLNQTIKRQGALRTWFRAEQGTPVQIIVPEWELKLPVVDLEGFPVAEREANAARLMQAESAKPFDLAAGPLVRGQLLRLGSDNHFLLLTFHHIVFDGWSVDVLRRELAAFYTAQAAGGPLQLPELPVQFVDYAAWQHQHLTPEVVEQHLDYWRQQLAGVPTLLELPGEPPRQIAGKNQIAECGFKLSAEVAFALRALGQRQGASLFATLLAAFHTLLHRYSGQGQILIGTPFAGRATEQLENLIGYFVNALPVKADLTANPTFIELLRQVRNTVWSVQAHQDLPFERLVRALQPARESHRNPFFQVFISLEVPSPEPCRMPGLAVELQELAPPEAMFDLALLVTDRGSGLDCVLRYNTDLLAGSTVDRLAGSFEKLIAGILANPTQTISKIPILPESEWQKILVEWNQTRRDYPRQCAHELFEAQAAKTPDAVAVVFATEALSYRELDERANRLAHRLRSLGVGPGKLAGLFVERSLEMVVGVLGILKAGAAYVPMDPKYPQERLAFMLADAQPLVILTQERLQKELPSHRAAVVSLDAPDNGATDASNPAAGGTRPQPDDLAYVIYTSGSTGRPKGVAIEHRHAVNFIHWGRENFSDEELAGVLFGTSICFDLSVFELFVPLSCGGKVILAESVLQLPQLPARDQVTLINSVPSGMAELVKSGGVPASVRTVNLAGEPLPTALVDKIYAVKNVQTVNDLYGPTETTTYSTYAVRQRGLPPTIGRPLANTVIYLLDARMAPVPVGVAGELYIGGAGVARGYLNRPELTAEKFIADPFSGQPAARLYKTGDLARYRPDGNIEYLGRMDQQVKVRGFRIELGEIETVLARHPAVRECVVVAREDAAGEKKLVAYLVARTAPALTVTDLREFLLRQLPEYMVPVAFVNLEKLPLTPNGKIDRKALPAPGEKQLAAGAQFVAPETPTELALAKIWSELLGVERIGIHDNFFALGGHSLLAVRMAFRIREALQAEVPVKLVSEFPTIAGLAPFVEKSGEQKVVRASLRSAPTESAATSAPRQCPASFSQQQLWFIDQLEPGRPVYNVPFAIRLSGDLNPAALQQSLNYVIQRHEVLRTVFQPVNGELAQVVLPELALAPELVDLENLPAAEREAAAQRQLQQRASQPFDLSCGPLIRAELLKLDARQHILLLTIHHIVFDGWSVDVLLRELMAAYAAFSEGRLPELPPLPMQYADYAVGQREALTAAAIEQHLDYWRRQLADVPTVLELPTDQPRPPVANHAGAHQVFTLPKELAVALDELGRRHGTTLFVTLLATFQTLLHRHCSQTNVLVGSPFSGRILKESEHLIGLFVNALPLRADFSGDPPFVELLRTLHRTVWEAQEHQELPFEKLVAELQPQRDLSRNPIFQTAFVFEKESLVTQPAGALQWQTEFVRIANVKFDLTLTLAEQDGALRGILEYATGLFAPETIRRLTEHYQNLLAAIVADPQQRVSGLNLLSDAARHQLLVEWNTTVADYPRDKTIPQLFEAQAAKTPDAFAVVCENKQLTYRELNCRANQLAHRLRAFGVGPDVLVGVYFERSQECVIALLGILKAGGAYVPLDTKNPKPRLQQQLTALKVLVTRTEFLPQLSVFTGAVVCLDRDRQELGGLGEANPEPCGTSENLAYVIFTSGSTGVPKGVAIRHRNLVNYAHFICRRLGLEAFPGGLKFALVSTLAADLGHTCLFPALLSGGSLQVVSEEVAVNPEGFARLVSRQEIDVLKITPSHLAALLAAKKPQAVLPRRFLILGGEALTPELVGRIRQLGGTCQIINHYGPTETTVGSLMLDEADFDLDRLPPKANVPIGRPIANTQAYILDKHLQPVPVGLRGQLYLGGAGVAQGYYQNPKLTAEKFICNPFNSDPASRLYVTGDLARYLPDGRIEFLGRMDQQVKIRGYRIELGEIEAAIREHPGVSQCVLMVQPPAQGESHLVAYIVPDGSQPLPATEDWRNFLKSKLPDYMIPAAFVSLKQLPLNANGKLDRQALPVLDWASSRPVLGQQVELPRTPLELQILLIWQQILYVKTIGVRDNFFDLGGHSLLAIRLISEINQSLNRNLTIPAFFRSPTIEGMAQTLEKEAHSNPEPKVIPLQPGEPGRSIFFLDASMGQCQLAQLLDGGPASYATIVPLSAAVFRAASRNDTKNLPTVEELAAPHAALIQKQQPSGTCILVGHSFGGLLAFEVARQLQRQGRMVEMILLLDSWATTPAWWRKLQVLSLTRARRSFAFRVRHWWSKTRPTPLKDARKKTPAPELAPVPDSVLEAANQPIGGVSWEILERVYRHARKNYRLHPLDSRAILFRAQHSEVAHYYAVAGKLGWDGLLTRGLVVVETPGDHFSLLKRPHLLTLAEHIKQCLKPSP